MQSNITIFFKSRAINGWGLFAILSIPMCFFNYSMMLESNVTTAEGVSYMIGYSVRWAVPFIYLAMAASSIKVLFPGTLSSWWMRNRKYIGLVFAVGMAWQAVFIFILSTFYRDYYFDEVYYFRDELEGSVGYIFLLGMVLTSFSFARKRMNLSQWKWIQKGGLYFLWAYAFSVYWWNIFYYPYVESYTRPETHDYIYYWAGFLAFAFRIAAWSKLRVRAIKSNHNLGPQQLFVKIAGFAIILLGVVASATGNHWLESVSSVISEAQWSVELGLWLPFWPLEPFMSLLLIGIGAYIGTKGGMTQENRSSAYT